MLKGEQVGTTPLREGEERKPFRKESSLQHRGAQGAPGGSDETSKLIGEGRMQPSPELRRDWEFYPGRKKGKIQVMLNPDQLNIALIRIQDKYVGPIAISVTLNIPHCLSSRSKLQHILFKVHQGPFERADKENKLRGEGEKPTPEEGARV